MTKNIARINILSWLLAYPAIDEEFWEGYGTKPQAGDLVSLKSAPASKWYLSWVHEIDPNNGWPKYLLESIEDGSLCWWNNVGLNIYSRKEIRDKPHWKWNDAQYKFNSRWMRICKKNDAYIVLPCWAVFNPTGSVTLDVRIRFTLDGYRNPKTFPNWKKVTIKEMEAYYLECVTQYEDEIMRRQKG